MLSGRGCKKQSKKHFNMRSTDAKLLWVPRNISILQSVCVCAVVPQYQKSNRVFFHLILHSVHVLNAMDLVWCMNGRGQLTIQKIGNPTFSFLPINMPKS